MKVKFLKDHAPYTKGQVAEVENARGVYFVSHSVAVLHTESKPKPAETVKPAEPAKPKAKSKAK